MPLRFVLAPWIILLLAGCQQQANQLNVAGLTGEVTVLRDSVGVNHIYAENEHDLFFAQGYCAARDRLYQFEIWRRQATGTVAEILGPKEVTRDIGARLFSFRGDMDAELNHYHPRGKKIITAFTDGINAYVKQVLADTSQLPVEFRLLGIKPGVWTTREVISRHQGILANLQDELRFARAVAMLGESKVKDIITFEPGDPNLTLDPALDKAALFDSIALVYDAFRATLKFRPEHIAAPYRNTTNASALLNDDVELEQQIIDNHTETIGSNNWIVDGAHSASGSPILANDPHRTIAVPSLRYMVHLNAPGWNVVGAGEPTIPGVSIGHNDHGAWGLTIFNLDAEDIYVYKLNADNQYEYRGAWESMTTIADTIRVKGESSRLVTHRFTRHGPVLYIDSIRHIAYAARCAWLDIGAAPYLASLRIDQATTWDEFRTACSYSRLPGENMIWADTSGTIGWQAVGVAPIRKNYSGLLPVPGNGTYEWDGYLPIEQLPNLANPENGFFATANENNVPPGYPYRNAVGWNWADRVRVDRINEVLSSRPVHTQQEMMQLQVDYTSLPARSLVPLLSGFKSTDSLTETLRLRVLNWNHIIDKNSVEAAVYVTWEKKLASKLRLLAIPPDAHRLIRTLPLRKVVAWLTTSGGPLSQSKARTQFLSTCFEEAVGDLKKNLGNDPSAWQYGQEKLHHTLIKHALSNVVQDSLRKKLNHGPLPRSGYGATPGVTSHNNNQSTGASFRIVADLSDWDKTMFTNTPGQSGDPESPYYGSLFEKWANDEFVPVYFSRNRVEKSTRERLLLRPE